MATFQAQKSTNSIYLKELYKKKLTHFRQTVNNLNLEYNSKLISQSSNVNKTAWGIINSQRDHPVAQKLIEDIRNPENGTVQTNAKKIADIFN